MKHLHISYGQWDWSWHLRLLPSLEVTNFNAQGLAEHYGYRYEICFRWLPWYCSFYFWRVDK
jgi:hypothetical protein